MEGKCRRLGGGEEGEVEDIAQAGGGEQTQALSVLVLPSLSGTTNADPMALSSSFPNVFTIYAMLT